MHGRRPLEIIVLAASMMSAACATITDDAVDDVVALERAALDRWGKGDPRGYLELYAPEVTYFDPGQERRVDGIEAMRDYLIPLTGKIRVDRYEMLDPEVQRHGDVAVLTFNIISYRTQPDGAEKAVARWNATEIYRRDDQQWKIIHSHWSFIKPELRQAVSEEQ